LIFSFSDLEGKLSEVGTSDEEIEPPAKKKRKFFKNDNF
jgi:hypothetical protein